MKTKIKHIALTQIALTQIDDFPEHPFQVRMDEDMEQLVESVKSLGVITPITLRKKDDGRYEIVSGHRRRKACEIAGIEAVPAEVKELTRDEAIILMVESNLQRSVILPSEKALAYKMKMDAMKRQGHRSDLTSTPVAGKLKNAETADIIGSQLGESGDQVRRYIRLNELNHELLSKVDEGQIAMRPAVELSYLKSDEQENLLQAMELTDATPSHAQAIKMRKFSQEGRLTPEVIESIMTEEKSNQKEFFRMPMDTIRKWIPKEVPQKQAEDYIAKALETLTAEEKSNKKELFKLPLNLVRKWIPKEVPQKDAEDYISRALEFYHQHQEMQRLREQEYER